MFSFRHGDDLAAAVGLAVLLAEAVGVPFCEGLEKKPRMLCCFPEVDMDELDLFTRDGVLGFTFSPILKAVNSK